jgi:hypothetical protein
LKDYTWKIVLEFPSLEKEFKGLFHKIYFSWLWNAFIMLCLIFQQVGTLQYHHQCLWPLVRMIHPCYKNLKTWTKSKFFFSLSLDIIYKEMFTVKNIIVILYISI